MQSLNRYEKLNFNFVDTILKDFQESLKEIFLEKIIDNIFTIKKFTN